MRQTKEILTQPLFIAACLAIVFCGAYWIGHQAFPFSTDESKYALNIPYPHPPLGRWLILTLQTGFGPGAQSASMSGGLLMGVSVGLLFLLAKRLNFSTAKALVVAILFGCVPINIRYAQSAYLSPWLVCSYLLSALGLADLFDPATEKKGSALFATGMLIGIWSQLQIILLLISALATFCYQFFIVKWRPRSRFALFCLLLAAAHVALVVFYIVGNPLIVGDVLGHSKIVVDASQTTGFFSRTEPAIYLLEGLLIVASVAALARHCKKETFRPLALFTTTFSLLLIVFLANNPTPYYFPYLIAPLFVSLLLLTANLEPAIFACAVIITSVVSALAGYHLLFEREINELSNPQSRAQVVSILHGTHDAIILGSHGYDVDYWFPAVLHKLPTDGQERRSLCFTVIYRSPTLSPDESAWLSQLKPITTIDSYAIYEQPTCIKP